MKVNGTQIKDKEKAFSSSQIDNFTLVNSSRILNMEKAQNFLIMVMYMMENMPMDCSMDRADISGSQEPLMRATSKMDVEMGLENGEPL